MEYLITVLTVFILGCLVHLEYKIGAMSAVIKRLEKNSKVESNKLKGRKKGEVNHE